jgi:hypothetical protein
MNSDAALPNAIEIPHVTIVIEPSTAAESISATPIGERLVSPPQATSSSG